MKIFGYEPAVILYAVNAAVALLVAYGLDLTVTQTGAITAIATGLLAGVAALMTRPITVSGVTGALATVLAASAAFGLHLTANQIGTAVTAVSIVLALLLRQAVTPSRAYRS
jgi:hypothetical protein